MPPAEETSTIISPRYEDKSHFHSKTVDKVLDIPIISDTMTEVLKITSTIGGNPSVKQATEAVSDGLKKIAGNQTVKQAVNTVCTRLEPAMSSLDQVASDKVEQIQTSYPAISMKTSELLEAGKETAYTKFNRVMEFVASFTVVQVILKMSEKSLSLLESGLHKRSKSPSFETKIRSLRRYLRLLRRAGAKIAIEESDRGLAEAGLIGQVASLLKINMVLELFGMELTLSGKMREKLETTQPKGEDKVVDSEEREQDYSEAEGGLEALKGDLSGYKSEEDPDYHPKEEEDNSSNSDTNSSDEEDEDKENQAPQEQADNDPGRIERDITPGSDEMDRRPESEREPRTGASDEEPNKERSFGSEDNGHVEDIGMLGGL